MPLVYPLKFILDCWEKRTRKKRTEFGLQVELAVPVTTTQLGSRGCSCWPLAAGTHTLGLRASTGTGLCFPTQVTQRFSNLSRRGSKSEIDVCVLSPLLLYEQTAKPKFKASNAAGIVPQRLQEQEVPDLDHVELRDAIFLHAHRERNAIFLYQHFGYKNLLAAQKHNPKAFSKGSLNNGKEMHRGSLKQIERKGEEREKWLFSILMAEHPIQEKKNQKTNNNRQTLISVIVISIIAERRIPGVLPDLWYQIEQNLSEEFWFASGDTIKAITLLTFALVSIRLSYATASPRKRCDKSSKWTGRSAAAHSLQCQQHTGDASSQKHQVLSSQIHLAARKGNYSTSSALSNNLMKKDHWILRIKTAEMYISPLLYSEL